MTEIRVSRLSCPDCGSTHVENLDWVDANTHAFVGGDAGEDYWCAACEDHPARLVHRDVTLVLCDSCDGHAWGSPIPLPGVLITADGYVERCDECGIYASDRDAAEAVVVEAVLRDSNSPARIRICLEGVET